MVLTCVSQFTSLVLKVRGLIMGCYNGNHPGGVLGPKTDGGVPLAAENWTQKRSREKWNLGPKRSNSVRIGSFNTPKDRFGVGGWEKIPQKDRVQSSECQKRGSKRRHIHITQHRGSTLPGETTHTTPRKNGSMLSNSKVYKLTVGVPLSSPLVDCFCTYNHKLTFISNNIPL